MQTFGHYDAFQHLASGGMAELYLARDRRYGEAQYQRLYVIKQLSPRLADKTSFLNMFVDEARVAQRLRHPNIVRVYDTGYSDDALFYTMEYLSGRDLTAIRRQLRAARTGLRLGCTLSIIIQVCRALDYAHELRDANDLPLNIVHRDVSPGNVFVTDGGVAKLLDFGIARGENRIEQTKTGILKGKLRHMSPEQALGLPVDRRSDVFSVSVLLWELTVGRTLFNQGTDLAVMRAIVDADAARPSSVLPGYPSALEEIVCTGLQRNVDSRYQTAGALADALEAYAAGAGVDTSSATLSVTISKLFSGGQPVVVSEPPAVPAEAPPYACVEVERKEEPTEAESRRPSPYLVAAVLYACCALGFLIACAVWS